MTSTTISLSVSISNYDSSYTINVTWIETLLNPCSDERDISDHYMEEYIPTMEYNIMRNYADYDITVTITNAAGSITSDTVNVTTMIEGKSYILLLLPTRSDNAPSAAPENIMIDEITVFTITVKWDPVDCIRESVDSLCRDGADARIR